MGQCTTPGCKTMLVCVGNDGSEIPFGQIESWSHNTSREESEGSYIAGTCVEPQPADPAVAQAEGYILVGGVWVYGCDSSSGCTHEISFNGKYCMDPTNFNGQAQRQLKCDTLKTFRAYHVLDDNSLVELWTATGTVENKNRTFPGGTETATFDTSISVSDADYIVPAGSPYC